MSSNSISPWRRSSECHGLGTAALRLCGDRDPRAIAWPVPGGYVPGHGEVAWRPDLPAGGADGVPGPARGPGKLLDVAGVRGRRAGPRGAVVPAAVRDPAPPGGASRQPDARAGHVP